jgi:phosphoglycolate phosphatase
MGKTMLEIENEFFDYLPPERRHELMVECMDYENEYISIHGGILMDKVEETLALLKKDYHLSVVSNCQEGYIPAFLTSMDMHRYFIDYEEWGRSGLLKADNIRLVMERNGAEKAVYVGDIQKDADASAKAGVPCIWAAYGFGHIDKPAGVLNEFSELPQVLKDLGYL